jgi:hypothetical protein
MDTVIPEMRRDSDQNSSAGPRDNRHRPAGEKQAAAALPALRHVLLPGLHGGDDRHHRCGREPRRAGFHLAGVPRDLLLPAFPQEGSPYVWTQLAFGRPLAAVNSVIYWISNPIWVGGSLTIVSFAAIEEFFGPVGGAWKYVYAAAFIWFTIGAAVVSLQYGKWVPTLGAWARGVVLAFFVFSVILYAARHGVHGFGGHAFLPTYAIFIAVVPVLILQLRRPRSAVGGRRGDDQPPA